MKLNKPTVSENQSELESYVEGLLKDNIEVIETLDSKVTPLYSSSSVLKEKPSKRTINSSDPLFKAEQRQTKQIKSAPHKAESLNNVEPPSGEQQSNQIPSSKVLDKPKITSQHAKASDSNNSAEQETNQSPLQSAGPNSSANLLTAKPDLFETKPDIENRTKIESSTNLKSDKVTITSKSSAAEHQKKIAQEFKAYKESAHSPAQELDPRLKNVEKLLSRIALASAVAPSTTINQTATYEQPTQTSLESELIQQQSTDINSEVAQASFVHRESKPLKELLGDVFQTLVFEVHKLPLAVPLVKLGGIVNFTEQEVTPLVGTPEWFLGLVPNERGNLMVVDTQRFLMPEKIPTEPVEYQYLIVLDDSNWALACHSVNDAKNLSPDDIRWSARSSKRPWFAGMVVEYMSALVEVDELINLLADTLVD